jgi:hypothetical protein
MAQTEIKGLTAAPATLYEVRGPITPDTTLDPSLITVLTRAESHGVASEILTQRHLPRRLV